MLIGRLYQLLWLLLHLITSIGDGLRWLVLRLQALASWSYDLCRSRAIIERRERAFLEHCKKQLTKLPQHLNLIVGPDNRQVTEEVLARIIKYALIMDINYISFYDTRSLRMGAQRHISVENIPTPQHVDSKELQDHHLRWTTNDATAHGIRGHAKCNNGSANGHVPATSKSLEIYEISTADNRPQIAEVCRRLFEQRHTAGVKKLTSDRACLGEYINAELSQKFGKFPDPELSIIFHRYTCTFGMLPWQTRFTEFHTHEQGLAITAETFAKVLYRYSRCEQRWGK